MKLYLSRIIFSGIFLTFVLYGFQNVEGTPEQVVVDFNRADALVNRGVFSYQGFMQIRESGDPFGLDTFKLVNPAGTDTRLEIWIDRMEPENDDNDPSHFNWDKLYPERMIRFIKDSGTFLDEVESLGMEHLLLLGYTVEWLRDPQNPEIPVKSIPEWVEYAAAVVESFNGQGDSYRLRARFVEVWNEPNLRDFWSGSQQLYFDLFNATAQRIHRDYPGVMVGGPALTRIPETEPERWMRDFLHSCGENADFISYHTYGEPVEKIMGDIKKWAAEFRTLPGKNQGRVMITESDNWVYTHNSWEKIKYMFDRQMALIDIQDLLWSFHHFCVMAYRESGQYEFGIVYPDGTVIDGTFWPFWVFRNYIGEQCFVFVDESLSASLRCVASRYYSATGGMQNIVLFNKGDTPLTVPLLMYLPDANEKVVLYSKVTQKFKGIERVEALSQGTQKYEEAIKMQPGEGLALTFVEPHKQVFAFSDMNYQIKPYLELKPMRSQIHLDQTFTLSARILNTLKSPIRGELRLARVPEKWDVKITGTPEIESLAFGKEAVCSFKITASTPVEGEVVAPYVMFVTDSFEAQSPIEIPHSIPVHIRVKNPIRVQSSPLSVEGVPGEINSAGLLIVNQSMREVKGTVDVQMPSVFESVSATQDFSVPVRGHTRVVSSFRIPAIVKPQTYDAKFIVHVDEMEYTSDFKINIHAEPLAEEGIPVDLRRFLDFDSVAYFDNRLDYDRAKMGNFVFPADYIPSARRVRLFGIPFEFPSVEDSNKNCILPQGQVIPVVPEDQYDAVAFIGFGHDGSHPGVWTMMYADGSTEPVDSQIPEWCTPPPPGMRSIMDCPYRYIEGGPASPACQLFYWEIKVNSDKTLSAIKLPVMEHAYIFSITALKK